MPLTTGSLQPPCEMCGRPDAENVIDPYLEEVEEEIVYRYLCRGCWQVRKDDI